MRKTQTPQESKTLPKNRILVVDDELDIAQVLKMGLEDNGFVVDVYNDPPLDSYTCILFSARN